MNPNIQLRPEDVEKLKHMENLKIYETHKLNGNQVSYKCEECFSSYKKNGEPTKRAKNICHFHGVNDTEMKNGYLTRASHCAKGPGPVCVILPSYHWKKIEKVEICEENKICKRCNYEKPITEFSRISRGSEKRRPRCKQCCSSYHKKNYEKNPDIYNRYEKTGKSRGRPKKFVKTVKINKIEECQDYIENINNSPIISDFE